MTAIVTTATALNKALETPPIAMELLAVANSHLGGASTEDIAEEFEISEERVVATLQNKQVQKYINAKLASYGYLNRKNRVELINKLIDDKLEEGSSKDIVDLIKLAQSEDKALAEKAPTTMIQNNTKIENIENILNKISEVE